MKGEIYEALSWQPQTCQRRARAQRQSFQSPDTNLGTHRTVADNNAQKLENRLIIYQPAFNVRK